MRDWKGNIISDGDTVLFIRTTPVFSRMSLVIPDDNGLQTIATQESRKYLWDVESEIVIFDKGGALFYETERDGYKFVLPIEGPFNRVSQSYVVCIKGKSDNEEEYYNNFFKV